jgi:hypothetical protein
MDYIILNLIMIMNTKASIYIFNNIFNMVLEPLFPLTLLLFCRSTKIDNQIYFEKHENLTNQKLLAKICINKLCLFHGY